jgi:hypothetical protein
MGVSPSTPTTISAWRSIRCPVGFLVTIYAECWKSVRLAQPVVEMRKVKVSRFWGAELPAGGAQMAAIVVLAKNNSTIICLFGSMNQREARVPAGWEARARSGELNPWKLLLQGAGFVCSIISAQGSCHSRFPLKS